MENKQTIIEKTIKINENFYVVDNKDLQEGDYFLYKNEEVRYKSSNRLVDHGGNRCHESGNRVYEVDNCKRIIRSTDINLNNVESMDFPDKKTAVDWIFLMLNDPNRDQKFAKKLYDKAKEVEKVQIINAFISGEHQQGYENEHEQYYQDTYGK